MIPWVAFSRIANQWCVALCLLFLTEGVARVSFVDDDTIYEGDVLCGFGRATT
jgi:hypothetical protein